MGTVLLPTDKAFSRGLLTVDQARRLELLLREMHSKAPSPAPLQSLPAVGHKHALDSAQVLTFCTTSSNGCFGLSTCSCAPEGCKATCMTSLLFRRFIGLLHMHQTIKHMSPLALLIVITRS